MFDEIKYRYRALSLWTRVLISVFVGVMPGVVTYFDDAPILDAELEAATATETAERKKLADAKDKVKNLPQVEEKLAFTSDQLKKAETRLPDAVRIDEVIQQFGKAANLASVQIKTFSPSGHKRIEGEYPYDEVKFKVTMSGPFSGLAQWLDSVSGTSSRAYTKSWSLKKGDSVISPASSLSGTGANGISALGGATPQLTREIAESIREEFRLDLGVDVVYYRVASAVPSSEVAGGVTLGTAPGVSAAPSSDAPAGSPTDPLITKPPGGG